VSNVVSVGVFLGSVGHLLNAWMHRAPEHSPGSLLAQPPFALALAGAIGSLLYMFAFFGVAFIHPDVAPAAAESSPEEDPSAAPRDVDADVVIMGAGCAGASLATALARDGKKVVVIERDMNMIVRIVGELMQPGGIRALERMGLGQCAKSADVDCINVDGYVCITPNTPKEQDLILTYPEHDPASTSEFLGRCKPAAAPLRTHKDGSTGASNPAKDARAAGTVDERPTGRSFHNHVFVQKLRGELLREKNASVHLGTVKGFVYAKELAAAADNDDSRALWERRTGFGPAPLFRGLDGKEAPLAHTPETLAQAGFTVDAAGKAVYTGGGDKNPAIAAAPKALPSAAATYGAMDPETIVGFTWTDETGAERVTTGRVCIVADGMWSNMRKTLHPDIIQNTSSFCGLLLHHPAHKPPVPYPNRGHVVMADPNPVLLYQISATETRILVDVPGKYPGGEELKKYFLETVLPQLPAESKEAFLEAVNTQKPMCMQNKRLDGKPSVKKGAVLLGDAWNMRHPLTGGGMTVALKDVEMLTKHLRGIDLRRASDLRVESAMATFQRNRAAHASTINVLANALHKVFTRPTSDNGTRARLRAACIDYMSMGGSYSAGPVGLLSGLTPKPQVLVAHFFAVAGHAAKLAWLPFPTPTRVQQGYDLFRVACMIILPLLEAEGLSIGPLFGMANLIFGWRKTQLLE
jgi:2-polyprenyl-6-methoxyphenol hydroxylase-like FAD-dependent oxidoreductase